MRRVDGGDGFQCRERTTGSVFRVVARRPLFRFFRDVLFFGNNVSLPVQVYFGVTVFAGGLFSLPRHELHHVRRRGLPVFRHRDKVTAQRFGNHRCCPVGHAVILRRKLAERNHRLQPDGLVFVGRSDAQKFDRFCGP